MITRIAWTPAIDAELTHPAGSRCIAFLKAEVLQGVSKLWHCVDGNDAAYMITRLDRHPTELVIAYFQGSGIAKFAPEVTSIAAELGIPIRAHTTQPAIVRLCRRAGLYPSEYVVRSSAWH